MLELFENVNAIKPDAMKKEKKSWIFVTSIPSQFQQTGETLVQLKLIREVLFHSFKKKHDVYFSFTNRRIRCCKYGVCMRGQKHFGVHFKSERLEVRCVEVCSYIIARCWCWDTVGVLTHSCSRSKFRSWKHCGQFNANRSHEWQTVLFKVILNSLNISLIELSEN